ncbi:MAG: rRNA maturation RNase YbeY [Nitrospiraceae bacterium]|nr:rRNA maturation RNase YbeY [Nitrospiraceae bacterium]
MKTLNRSFRGMDKPTDVLSFPFFEEKELKSLCDCRADGLEKKAKTPFILGEIVICPEVAARNAALYGATLAEEMRRLLVHGFVHLLGYDHEKSEGEARRMRRKERELINALERMD